MSSRDLAASVDEPRRTTSTRRRLALAVLLTALGATAFLALSTAEALGDPGRALAHAVLPDSQFAAY